MGSLSFFLAENVDKRENKKIIVSERFKDDKGKPVKWEFRSIAAGEDEDLRKMCTRRVPVDGKRNQFTQDFDSNKYLALLTAKSVVYPDLHSKELQDSYRVMGAEQLIRSMLYKDEFDKLTEAIVNISEVQDINDVVEEAKN